MSVFNSNIFLKSFISYVALLVVPIFLIGGVSYYKAANVAEKQLLNINLMALEKVKDYYDKSFRDIRRISILVNELPWLRDILLMDEKLDYERINEGDFAGICLQLRNYRFSNDFFKDIKLSYYNAPQQDVGLYLQTLPIQVNSTKALLIIQLNLERMKEIIQQFSIGEKTKIFILDENNHLFLSSAKKNDPQLYSFISEAAQGYGSKIINNEAFAYYYVIS